MSEVINDGGPAFPFVEPAGPGVNVAPGMNMRDYLAAQVAGGVLHMIASGQHQQTPGGPSGAAFVAVTAYEVADAMLKARSA